MWVVIRLIKGESQAARAVEALEGEGIMARLHPVYKNVSAEDNYYQVMVLRSEAAEASEVLAQKGWI